MIYIWFVMSTASTNDDATVTRGTCRDNSGGPRRRPTYVKVVISAVAIVVSWTRLLLGAPSLALANHDTVVISSSILVRISYNTTPHRLPVGTYQLLILDRSWKGWVLTAQTVVYHTSVDCRVSSSSLKQSSSFHSTSTVSTHGDRHSSGVVSVYQQ